MPLTDRKRTEEQYAVSRCIEELHANYGTGRDSTEGNMPPTDR
jgi:hypothetical protein